MNSYLKNFLHRGLIFAGFGPIVAGIVLYIVSLRAASFSLSGLQILTAILSTGRFPSRFCVIFPYFTLRMSVAI